MKDNSSPSLGGCSSGLTVTVTADYQVICPLISSLTSSVPLLQPGRQIESQFYRMRAVVWCGLAMVMMILSAALSGPESHDLTGVTGEQSDLW